MSARAAITRKALARAAASSSVSKMRRLRLSSRRSPGGWLKLPPGPELSRVNRLKLRQRDRLHAVRLIDKDSQPVHRHRDLHRFLSELGLDLPALLVVERAG